MEAYEEIYQRMKTAYCTERGAEIDEAGDIAIRLRVLAGEIYNMQTELEWLKRQLSPEKATGVFLDHFAQQRGISRKAAVKASGTLEFRLAETRQTEVVIPAGTVVSTDTESPVRVYTTEACAIPANTYAVTVGAEAEQAGYRGNINANIATIPVSVPSEVDSVTNLAPFRGGADTESDETLRARGGENAAARGGGALHDAHGGVLRLHLHEVGIELAVIDHAGKALHDGGLRRDRIGGDEIRAAERGARISGGVAGHCCDLTHLT